MRFLLPMSLVLTPLVSAINIMNPAANSTYAAGSTITVNWTTVDTDPSQFSLYLWNFVSWPPSYVPLAENVPTGARSYSVKIPCDTNPEWGYQISAINGTNVYIIHAQGERFTVSHRRNGTRCADSLPLSSPSTCSAAAAVSTVYVTVSPTGSSSHLLHHSSHGVYSTHAIPAPSLSTTTASSRYVKPGIVPKTIGWCSDYSHPVTLDKVPTPTHTALSSTTAAAMVTTAPGKVPSGGEVRVVTITTTVSVAAPAGDERCLFV
ncbi:Ser-Thr-rich glycosyl-phosphatidyl-inositol-anchored membrane family-domain-containing protein [Aspergillus coremiiformis]|uniref:Ser-Thr-rich glycosyl-phosphatidyl-inositol-anchored membrane family-domain-containing protein n=1 Tax=Aspergillus coremiiformis TaxID=138285 RepID=A0A5N6YZZ5_9EURO|nr:Ser-Thr-rich glycosyl-phosphatidyl-inositol-anchored membrane family-domain-containing protein [Aspergillus coremiiformis]